MTQRGTACDLSSAVSPIRPEIPHYCRRWNSQFFAYEAPMHSYYYMFKQQTWNPASLRMTNKRSRCLSNGRIFFDLPDIDDVGPVARTCREKALPSELPELYHGRLSPADPDLQGQSFVRTCGRPDTRSRGHPAPYDEHITVGAG